MLVVVVQRVWCGNDQHGLAQALGRDDGGGRSETCKHTVVITYQLIKPQAEETRLGMTSP
jgi:hypothetical protein